MYPRIRLSASPTSLAASAGENAASVTATLGSLLGPGADQPPDEHQLAQVIGGVIGHQHYLPQQRLPFSPGERREEILGRVEDQRLHGLPIHPERPQRRLPPVIVGWCGGRRPVALRPFRRLVGSVLVAAEPQDVLLGEPHVLDQLPRGIGRPSRYFA